MTGALKEFRLAMDANVLKDPADIADLLGKTVKRACARAGLAEASILWAGAQVTMLLSPKHAWEAVVETPNSYRLHPGHVRPDGAIVWADAAAGEGLMLSAFVRAVEREIETAAQESADA
jgi:hypothetical protein